jgi:hypothetical protein
VKVGFEHTEPRIFPVPCLSTQVGRNPRVGDFMRVMPAGSACLVSSRYTGAVGARSAPGTPSTTHRWTTSVLRRAAHRAEDVLSPRRADSAHTITMIAVVTMPVIADTAPCMPDVARLAMSARRPAGRDSGAIGGLTVALDAGTRSTRSVYALGSPGMGSNRSTEWSSSAYLAGSDAIHDSSLRRN